MCGLAIDIGLGALITDLISNLMPVTDNGGSRMLSDRYLLLDRLGHGGMGTVWRATDQLLNRTVAVKEIHLHDTDTDAELVTRAARARREAHTIAQISHPNVVNVHDLVDQDERLWLVMEFVDGPSLKEQVTAGGPMDSSDVARIGLQLLAALGAVHATGALHRDIKPDNVLLHPDGRVLLCDFGIAALAGTDSITATGSFVGSAEYIAPERVAGQPAGPPSDLFSLGATLCVLLSGRSPFARPEVAGVLNAIVREEPEIPDAAGPLRPLLAALLRKSPDDRPSVAEVSEALRPLTTMASAAHDHPTGGQKVDPAPMVSAACDRPTGGQKVDPAPRRRRVGWAALSAAVLLAVVATAGVLVGRSGSGTGVAETTSPAQPLAGRGSPAPTGPTRTNTHVAGTASPARPPTGRGSTATRGHGSTAHRGHGSTARKGPTRADAVMPVPGDPNLGSPGEYWIFSGDHYIRGRISASGYPLQRRLTKISPVQAWDDTFKRLPGFRNRIDATLRVPGSRNEYWVFSGNQYIRIRLAGADKSFDDTLVAGPKPLSDWEDVLGGLPGDGIDAVIPTPDDPNQYWVFAGDQYARAKLNGERPGGRLLAGPSKINKWSTLSAFASASQGIDAAMPVPKKRNDYWVFSGSQYMKIRLTDGAYKDTILKGPTTLRNWADLR